MASGPLVDTLELGGFGKCGSVERLSHRPLPWRLVLLLSTFLAFLFRECFAVGTVSCLVLLFVSFAMVLVAFLSLLADCDLPFAFKHVSSLFSLDLNSFGMPFLILTCLLPLTRLVFRLREISRLCTLGLGA